MGKTNQPLLAFNRGLISLLGMSRIDVARVALSAEIQTNWLPRLLGSMMLRPGMGFIGSTYQNEKSFTIPFIYSKQDIAGIEITSSKIRIWNNADTLVTREAVDTTILNGDFDTDLTSWTDADEVGATSQWLLGGYMELTGDSINYANRYQLVPMGASSGMQHALRIVVTRGPVLFRVSSTLNGGEYISEQTLGTGTHSLTFTPTGAFYVEVYSNLDRTVLVDSIDLESAGVLTLPSPYSEADLSLIRHDQSSDIVYITCKGLQQRRIERRSTTSWSIVLYQPTDGPVKVQNTTRITLAAGALTGNTTLTASKSLFNSSQVGGLYKLISDGQNVNNSASSADTFTDYIIVSGIGTARYFTRIVDGTWAGTITLQRSFDEGSSWLDVTTFTNGTSVFADGLDDQVVWYRIGFKAGDYTSGTAELTLSYDLGSITGYCRITKWSNPLSVNIEILKNMGSTSATLKWSEGEWSDYRGWPSALALAEGRLFHAGLGKIWGSISDAYESFDDDVEGDSGLISRNIGQGSVKDINWILGLHRIFLGTDTAEKGIKTSSLEEPITPTNYKLADVSTQGSAHVGAIKLDKKGVFAQSNGTKIYQLDYSASGLDYTSTCLNDAVPEVGEPSIVKIAVQRQIDTTIHCIRSDGKVAVLLFDEIENLRCWIVFETDGVIEDVDTYPGDVEDKVYYTVKRTINGADVRFREKFALQSECQGGTLNKQADSFITYSGVSTTTITGLSHLEGEEVVVWADGVDLSPDVSGVQTTYTVTSGAITLSTSVTNAVVGLPYTAKYKSSQLAYAAASPLNQPKKINALGIIARNIWWKGLKYGKDFDNLQTMPEVVSGKVQTAGVYDYYNQPMSSFAGSWDVDSRLCLQAQAPRPCTLLAVDMTITTNEKQ